MSLREELERMTLNENVAEHEEILAEISRIHPNAIAIVDSTFPLNRYTCVMHAFQFTEKEQYVHCAMRGVFAGAEFIYYVIPQLEANEINPKDAGSDDLILYFDDGDFKHIGKLVSTDEIKSKWGVGHLYRHRVWEVPASYGGSIRIFKPIKSHHAMSLFLSFASKKGLHVDEIAP